MAFTCLSKPFSLFSPLDPNPPPTIPKSIRTTKAHLLHFPKTHLPLLCLTKTITSISQSKSLCLKAGYNVQMIVGEEEGEEVVVRRFRREVLRAGVIQECRRRRFFEDKQEKRKRKIKEASKRNRRRRRMQITPLSDKQEENKKEEEEDNWDLPEGELPY
ncbi:hypothetical protein QJS04_geneDACA016738 [Acorus gramineus]|uniref:Mitochondrial ribosomal protein S21 n=1 Tax=Acorus gramineus TaxID=55184 RepID=A0AAV9AQ32_ACOGR|nr:hypothetical protein QJS04_geneDACA016738 [Acorus gramineus]